MKVILFQAHRIYNHDKGSLDPWRCCASADGTQMHARALDRWRQNMRCRDRSHAFPRQMVASAHGYWNSDALLDVLDHIAQQHRCEFVPEATLKIEWKYTFHWVLGRRQWNGNPTHPLTTPKQQTCQWEGRWMLFFYRPKCSYRFMFSL